MAIATIETAIDNLVFAREALQGQVAQLLRFS